MSLVMHREVRQTRLPDQRDIFPGHLFEITNGSGLSCKAIIGVVVRHNGGSAQLAQFILGALQLHLHGLQFLMFPAIH